METFSSLTPYTFQETCFHLSTG